MVPRMHCRPSLRVLWSLVALVLGAVAASVVPALSPSTVGAGTVSVGGLRYGPAVGDSALVALDGARVGQREIYVTWERPAPDTRHGAAEFRLDGVVVDSDCCSVTASPAVARGATSPGPSVRSDGERLVVGDGHHVVTATAIGRDGRQITASASFTVDTASTLVSVTSHGTRGDGVTDDTDAVKAAFAAAASSGADGVRFPPGTYKLTRVIDIPDSVHVVELDPGAVVRQFANDSAFQKVGSVGSTQYAITDARRGQRVITLGSTAGLSVGDWFYFGSDDVFHSGKGFKRGFLRRIDAISGTEVTVDKPLHHSLQTAPRGWEVTLAPPVELRGGVVEQHDPKTKFHSILHFELVRDPRVIGTELRDCGAAGVKTIGTVGGLVDTFIHRCLDDENGTRYNSGRHYGYGVEAAGATRDLVVRGTSTQTRHAFTTSGAYGPHSDKRLLLIGEPEDVVVSMDVWETTSSGLDTHEPGWNIQFRDCSIRDAGVYKRQGSTNGKEGGFGLFIRSRGTVVENCVITGSAEDGLTVAAPASGMTEWSVADGPVIRDTQILATQGKRGLYSYQPVHFQRVTIKGHHLVGMHMNAKAVGSTGDAVVIDLQGYGGSFGVIGEEYISLTGLVVRNATRLYG